MNVQVVNQHLVTKRMKLKMKMKMKMKIQELLQVKHLVLQVYQHLVLQFRLPQEQVAVVVVVMVLRTSGGRLLGPTHSSPHLAALV